MDSSSERKSASSPSSQCLVRGTDPRSEEETGPHLADGVIPGDSDQCKLMVPQTMNGEKGMWMDGKGSGSTPSSSKLVKWLGGGEC